MFTFENTDWVSYEKIVEDDSSGYVSEPSLYDFHDDCGFDDIYTLEQLEYLENHLELEELEFFKASNFFDLGRAV